MSRRRAGLSFRRQRRKFNLPLFKEIVSWVVELIVVIGLAYVLVSFFGIRTNVVGQAMEQTLENDDNILVNRFAYIMSKPKAGDVIVFLPNGNNKSHYYVRRVVAVHVKNLINGIRVNLLLKTARWKTIRIVAISRSMLWPYVSIKHVLVNW